MLIKLILLLVSLEIYPAVSAGINNEQFGIDPSVLGKYALTDAPKEWFNYGMKLLYNLLSNMRRTPWGLQHMFIAFKNNIKPVLTSGSSVDFSFHHVDQNSFWQNWMEGKPVCWVYLLCLCFSPVDLHVAAFNSPNMLIVLSVSYELDVYFFKQDAKCEVTYLTGTIRHIIHSNIKPMGFGPSRTSQVIYVWSFHLDWRLRLNMSFHHITIQYMNLQSCLLGHLAVVNNDGWRCGMSGYEPHNLKSRKSLFETSNKNFRYCGAHSHLINYFSKKNIKIEVTIIDSMKSDFLMSYMVTDSHRIHSFPGDFSSYPQQKLVIYFYQTEMMLFRYYLCSHKYRKLKIVIPENHMFNVQIWDGPSPLSKPLTTVQHKPAQLSYSSLTFQCTVSFVVSSLGNQNETLQYTTVMQDGCNRILVNMTQNRTITFANISDTPVVLCLKLHTEFGQRINITINKFVYTGKKNKLCQYAGINAYNTKDKSYSELPPVCFSADFYRHRNIYSEASSLLLVLYSYPEYGHVYVALGLGVTECQVSSVNLCLLEERLSFPHINLPVCRTPRDYPNCKCETCERNAFELSVQKGTCLIVQVNHDAHHSVSRPRQMQLYTCHSSHVKHIHVKKSFHQLKYTLTGFLKGE